MPVSTHAGDSMRTLSLLASLLFVVACSPTTEPSSPARPVRTVVATVEQLAPEVSYSGEVVARYVTPLSFRVNGKLAERRVDVGSRVKPGQALARLELEDLNLNAASQQAARHAAESELARAKAEYDRYVQLREKKLVSELDFKRIETALRVAEAQFEQALAQSRVLDNQASYGLLTADAAGVITAIQAEVGQVVGAGQPVMTLAKAGEREITIDVPESRIDELKKAAEIQISLWANPNVSYQGKVREMAPDADRVTRTYTTRISILNPDDAVQLGKTATVSLKGVAKEGIKLPLTALYQTADKPMVWIVGNDEKVALREVSIGQFFDNDVVILSGLEGGERIVTAGVNRLVEGQHVALTEAP